MNLIHCEFRGVVMNKSDLIETLSKDTGLPIRKAEEVVKALFNSMANAVVNNDLGGDQGLWEF
jgi:hypothetical protein